MKVINIAGLDPVAIKTNARLLDAAQLMRAPLQSICGGKGLCATCHVQVTDGAQKLSQITPREEAALQMLANRTPTSRLACQAKVLGDGILLQLPSGRYTTSSTDVADFEKLIGRRAEEHVLHPIDGRILVEAGKLITRTRIDALRSASVDLEQLHTRTISHHRGSSSQ
jgi:ferredoxin